MLLLITTITIFFSFNINVNAESKKGSCTYNPTSSGALKVKVSQSAKGKITHYYYSNKKGKWIKIKGTKTKIEGKKDNQTTCPYLRIFKVSGAAKLGVYKKYKHVIKWGCTIGTEGNCYSGTGEGYFNKANNGSKGSEDDLNTYSGDINKDIIDGDEEDYKSCKEILGEKLVKKLQEIVNIIRIMVPILLIVFGIMDFGKAIFASDENEMKKAQSKFIKRLIIAISFFIIPSILQIILNIAANVWNIQDPSFCGIKF